MFTIVGYREKIDISYFMLLYRSAKDVTHPVTQLSLKIEYDIT